MAAGPAWTGRVEENISALRGLGTEGAQISPSDTPRIAFAAGRM